MLDCLSDFHQSLLSWYDLNKRDLPWRRTSDPYEIWISEVMLQQTQVNTVIPYYENFLRRFPTISDLAKAELESVLKVWEGLGYYARARNLHSAALQIMSNHDGILPSTLSKLKQLPGIGDYTAAAVMSIAFNSPIAAVDGNIKRVFSRLMMMPQAINKPESNKVFSVTAASLLHKKNPGDYNQALMELGALICSPQNPECSHCPLVNLCEAARNHKISDYPVVAAKPKIPTYKIAVAIIIKGDRLLITKRKEKGLLGGLWEFPGGKLNNDEGASEACIREVKEETGLKVEPFSRLTHVKHAYTHFKIEMDVFLCRFLSGKVNLSGPVDFRWIELEQINDFPFPKANHKFLPALKTAWKSVKPIDQEGEHV
jgi:A/G-specific adenine glycosylase